MLFIVTHNVKYFDFEFIGTKSTSDNNKHSQSVFTGASVYGVVDVCIHYVSQEPGTLLSTTSVNHF